MLRKIISNREKCRKMPLILGEREEKGRKGRDCIKFWQEGWWCGMLGLELGLIRVDDCFDAQNVS